jgi:hypothetical protein
MKEILALQQTFAARERTAVDKPRLFTTGRSISVLLHGGTAGRAEIALLPRKTGGDGPNIGDFASAETIDVRRAGPPLLRRTKREGRVGGNERESEAECSGGAFRGRKGNDS